MFDTLELQRGSYQLKELLSNRVSRTWQALSPTGEKVVLKELPIGQLENRKSYDLFQREL